MQVRRTGNENKLTGSTNIFLETRMKVATKDRLDWAFVLAGKKILGMEGVPKNHFAARFVF